MSKLFSQGFEVKPMKLYFGDNFETSQTITIKNLSNQKTEFAIFLSDYTKDYSGRLILIKQDSLENSCSNSISFFPSIIEIDSLSEKTISVKFDKQNSSSIIQWGMLIIKPISNKDSLKIEKKNIVISPQIAVKIYCNNAFDTKPNLKISDILKNDSKYSAEISNETDAFERLNISILLSNVKTLEEKKIDEISSEFLPKSKRILKFEIPEISEINNFTILIVIKDEEQKLISAKELLLNH